MGDHADSGAMPPRATFVRAQRVAAAAVLIAVLGVAFVGATASGAVPARAARTLTLSETGHLHLTSHHGFTLNEQGSTSGTISGTIYIHLNIVSTNRVTAEVNIYPNGGSITGNANASYRPAGGVATFDGTMYDHAGKRPLRRRQRLRPHFHRHRPALERRRHGARQRPDVHLTRTTS